MARLRVSDNGVAFDVYLDDKLRVRLGRADECEVTLEDTQASRLHAEVTLTDAGFVLQDQGSANGTRVNGRPVQRHSLRDGDEIRIGAARIAFNDPDQVERLRQAAAAGAVPVPVAPVAAPAPERRPAGGSGRQRAPSGRHRASGRVARRRGGLDGLLVGGGVLVVGLVVAVVALAGARRDVSRDAQAVIDDAKALAGKRRYQDAIAHLGRLPANAPPALVERARSLQQEWRRAPAAYVREAAAEPEPAAPVPAPAPRDVGDAAFAALQDADARAIPAAGAGRFGEALSAYGPVIERYPGSDAAEQARARREKILDDASALWTTRHERAVTLARGRQFDAARQIYQQIIDQWGLPEFEKLARDRLDYVNDLATH